MSKGTLSTVQATDDALNERGVGPFPLPIGRLARVTAGVVDGLSDSAWWAPSMRDIAGVVALGVDADRINNRTDGYPQARVIGPGASVADRALVAVGMAMAGESVVVSLGIGSVADGAFYEAMNTAALYAANVTFVVAVEPLSAEAPLPRQVGADPVDVAKVFGFSTTIIKKVSVAKVREAVKSSLKVAGPSLIEVRL